MASINNRSRFVVAVDQEPALKRTFSFSQLKKAKQYLKELRAQNQPAVLTQLEDHLLVRIRDKGYPKVTFIASSYQEAEDEIQRIAVERKQGRRVDYNKARGVTLAFLMHKYYDEECPRHKGCVTERYTLGAFLTDINYQPFIERRRAEEARSGKSQRNYLRHAKRTCIEWLLKPFADLEPADFNRYVEARKKQDIKAATIDREFDLIAQVINWAIKTLRYRVEIHPLDGFKRPKYFNERNRRLRGDEAERLIDSVREEDHLRSFQIAVEEQLETLQQQGPPKPRRQWNKYFLWQARKRIKAKIRRDFIHIPFWEALLEYLLSTTSRRSEALALTWTHTYLEDNEAFYPDTKTGRSRTVPVRQHVVELLKQLPRQPSDDRVFPVTGDQLDGAWHRICKRAGIKDYRLHDNRHEGVSETAEIARAAGMALDAVSLGALTGHRDLRSLARYMNLCGGELAGHIDDAYEIAKKNGKYRKGRIRATAIRNRRATSHVNPSRESSTTDRENTSDDLSTPPTADMSAINIVA